MESAGLKYQPVEGKTYSLFGHSDSTSGYYKLIRQLADDILSCYDINFVIQTIGRSSSRKRYLQRLIKNPESKSLISFCLNLVNPKLKQFTENTREHLRDLPITKFWDKRLSTTEEQYHLYMLEIELTNRLNKSLFMESDRKISLQPYCLQDFTANCKAKNNGFDSQCRFCSQNCFQNHASKILKNNNVEPYIWMGASISKAAREADSKKHTFGILGIACIPELVWGMRKCRGLNIPVVGIPLNANRCARWFGEFYQNSIDLNELIRLLNQ
jgi:hypothetical protein